MKKVLKEIFSTIIYLIVIFCLTFLFIHFVAQRTEVSGRSMEPTLQDGDSLIVDKISYRFKDPQRYDIVVFPFEYEDHTYFIKRIIGLPGETVQIDTSGNIYINGKVLKDDVYGKEVIADPGRAVEPVKLGADEYFVMGDNRNNSMDSRDPQVGSIKRKDLIGRAWVRVYPFHTFGVLN
jgi:signal peptidase I